MAKRKNRRSKRQKNPAPAQPEPQPKAVSSFQPDAPASLVSPAASAGPAAAPLASAQAAEPVGEDLPARDSSEKFARFTRLDGLIAACVSVLTAWIYTLTLVPTVYAEDSGEFITGALKLGVVHPPGYPLYTMLSHMFRLLPFGSPAWRINFSSAVFGGVCIGAFYLLCRRLIKDRWAAAGAALVFGFSRVFWSQALHAEVYSLNMLFICAMFLALIQWRIGKNDRWLYLGMLIVGLALTNHTTSVLFPIVFAFYMFLVYCLRWETLGAALASLLVALVAMALVGTPEPGNLTYTLLSWLETPQSQVVSDTLRIKEVPKWIASAVFVSCFGGFLLYRFGKKLKTRLPVSALIVASTLLIYMYVPTRALAKPEINFGNPDSLGSLIYTIERRQYEGDLQPENYFENKMNFMKDLVWQFQTQFAFYEKGSSVGAAWLFGAVMAVLCIFGSVFFWLRNWRLFIICAGVGFAYSVYIILRVPDPDTLHKMDVHRTMYIPTWAMASICWGFAWVGLRDWSKDLDLPKIGRTSLLQILCVCLPMLSIAGNYYVNDRAKNWLGYDFCRGILDCIEPGGILFVEGDDTITYNLLYHQKVEDYRTDVKIYDHFGIALYNPFAIDPNGLQHLPGTPPENEAERRKLTQKLAQIRKKLGRDPDTIFDLREDMFTHEIDELRRWKHDILIETSGQPCYYWQQRDLRSLGVDANGAKLYDYEWNSVVGKVVKVAEGDFSKPWLAFPVRGVSAPAAEDGSVDYDAVQDAYGDFQRDYRSSLLTTYYAERKAFFDYHIRNFAEAIKGFRFALKYMPNDGMYFNLAIAHDGYFDQATRLRPPEDPAAIARWTKDLSELHAETIASYRDYLENSPQVSDRSVRSIERLAELHQRAVDPETGLVGAVKVTPLLCEQVLAWIDAELKKGEREFSRYKEEVMRAYGKLVTHQTEQKLFDLRVIWVEKHRQLLSGEN